jgi:cytochrome c-type biogenesis protein CcmE
MSKIDDELAKAVEDSEADEAARPVVMQGSDEPQKKPRRELLLLGLLLAIGAGILTLVMTNFNDSAIYSKGVDEMLAQKSTLGDRNLRVQGTLVKGTLARRDSPCEYRFRMKKNGAEVEVRYPQCVVPDTFRDVPNMDVDVTATGKLAKDGHFQASQIMAKCPSKYDMKQMAASGKQMPHGQMGQMGSSAAPAPQTY